MKEESNGFLSKISDNVKVGFFRWWFVGAIYFFVGWGTGLGNSKSAFDLIFIRQRSVIYRKYGGSQTESDHFRWIYL